MRNASYHASRLPRAALVRLTLMLMVLLPPGLLLLGGCAGASEPGDGRSRTASSAEGPSAEDTLADAATTGSDTTDSDTTDDARAVDSGLTPEPAPPPGAVEVRAVVEGCTTEAEEVRCTLEVEAVLRSGMAAPVLAPGRHTVRVATHVAEGNPSATLTRKAPRELRLSASSESPGAESAATTWTLVRVL